MPSAIEPLSRGQLIVAHGGVLTGHWEFDLAILSVFLGIVVYSFLLPQDAPRGLGRILIYTLTIGFLVGALVLAVFGLRSVALGQ
ncbi:MAG: hypothetical protein IT331_24425 [Anaerolineae bacterium]|nr:hypothetical protein [Anaerolineae bacterium]